MKILGVLLALLLIAGCSPFNRGYFRLNQDDGGRNTDWARTSQEVGVLLRK